MTSSQVEIASSSPFGYVLRDRNQNSRVRKRDSNAFRKNFNDLLVQTQLASSRNNAGSNENSHPAIDLADLWVHHPHPSPPPPPPSDDDNQHALEMGHARISEHSNSNNNSRQHIDYTDLWVHNPHRDIDESTQSKPTSDGKRDDNNNNSNRVRDNPVHAVDRKCEISVSSGPIACPSPRGRNHNGAQSHSQPVSRIRRPQQLSSVSSSVGRLETGCAASTSLKEKNHAGKSSSSSFPSPVFPSPTDSSAEVPNLGAVSSLVQKWRSFEGRRSYSLGSNCSGGSAFLGNASFVEAIAAGGSDACEESADIRPDTPAISEDLNGDWESVRTGFSASPGRDSDTAENEKIRVVDIIRKLSCNGEELNDRDQAIFHESSSSPHIHTSVDQSEQRPLTPFFCSPLVRGRQAFSDFQIQMERERHKELDALAETKAVSKFSYRGRIQAVLKVRFLHRGADVKDHQRLSCSVSDSNRPKRSAILHLREIFNMGAKQCSSQPQRSQAKLVDSDTEIEKSSISCREGNGNPQKKSTEPIKSATVVQSDTCAHSTRDIVNHASNDLVEKNKIEVQNHERKENHPPEQLPQQEKDHVTASKGSSDTESSFRLMPVEGDMNHRQSDSMIQSSAPSLQNSEKKVYHEASSGSNYIQQYSSPNFYIHGKPEFPTTGTSSQCSEGNVYTKFYEANNQQLVRNESELINVSQAPGDWKQEKVNNHHLDCSWVNDWINDGGFEELQSDYSQEEVENHDWINNVSRPRSTWEDLRQARYQEMLDPFVENDDIRCLLRRKSVSSFLSSGMRESIDRLMMSRTQEISRKDHLEGKYENQYNRGNQMRVNEVKEEHECAKDEEYKQHSEEEEEAEDDSIVYSDDYEDQEQNIQTEQYNAAQSYINQATSWVYSRHHGVSNNDSDQAAAPPVYIEHSPLANARILESQRSNISCLESQRSMNHHSVEMELIYELKGNMDQLHQEISEIRRSLKTCVNMQMELQQSIKQEIVTALCQPGKQKRRERMDPGRGGGGRCCICCEEQIDSLLYRCGHMCTCFTCAHELLQWGSGKCPVCRAPILDIVRAYAPS